MTLGAFLFPKVADGLSLVYVAMENYIANVNYL